VVLDADPLADVRNLRRIGQVMQGGRLVNREHLPAMKVLTFDPEGRWPR